MADEIIAARVRELLHYDPITGFFTRKVRLAQRHQVGDRADFLITSGNNIGYMRVSFDSKRYLAHRVAWLYVHGHWPSKDIDHKDTVRHHNWIDNLRDVPNAINRQNVQKCYKTNTSGFLGVTFHPEGNCWRASVTLKGKRHHIGLYPSPEEAHQAYLVAKRRLHEGCTI